MKFSIVRLTQSLLAIVFLGVSWAQVQAAGLPAVQNVSISGDQLTWDAVEGATGYNIYSNGYLDTVRDSNAYTLSQVGTYRVVAFDNDGNFSPAMFTSSNSPFYEGGVDNRERVVQISGDHYYATIRCFDINAGETCTASCPDFDGGIPNSSSNGYFIGSAIGGACSSSDTAFVSSHINPDGYNCTVPNFSARVEAQVVCPATPSN